jgi:cobalt/nickel transport system ATP-binding protein
MPDIQELHDMTSSLLELQGVNIDRNNERLISDINFHLNPGERVTLLGANGTGKSTFLDALVGLHPLSGGDYTAFGKTLNNKSDFHQIRSKIGLVFQDSDDQLFCPSVIEDVAFGPINLGHSPRHARAIALDTLNKLGLGELSERITYKLSGGEKRLVSIATVLAMDPDIILLDEPTTGLDESARQRLIKCLAELSQALVFTSHDQDLIDQLATRAVLIKNGSFVNSILHQHPHVHVHSHKHVHSDDDLTHTPPSDPEHSSHYHPGDANRQKS